MAELLRKKPPDPGQIACATNRLESLVLVDFWNCWHLFAKIFQMRRLEVAFDKYGRFLSRHPLPFLIFPVIITLISCVGLLNFHSQDDIWDIYAPINALSRVEEAAQHKFEYIAANHHYRIQVLVERKDGGSLMNSESLQELGAVNNFIVDNVTATNGQRSYHYRDMCGIYCNESNAFVIGFVQAGMQKQNSLFKFQLSYPTGQAFNNPVFLGYSLGNVETEKQDDNDIVTSFKLFILHYMVDLNLPNGRKLQNDFERKLMALFETASAESKILNFSFLSRNRELTEQRAITITALPYLGLTGVVLTIFMLITLLDDPLYKSQCIEALFGVISPGMALITTFGLVWGAGLPFSNILTVVPFLVITIGIDDAFLILAGWRQSNPSRTLEERMGEALSKSGASVSVTSITDVLCFGVGTIPVISNMPVVRLFCTYTSIALAIDFIYQITFFTAVVVYCGKRQILLEEAHRASTDSSPSGSISSHGSWRRHLIRKAERLKGIFTVQQIHPENESSKVAEVLQQQKSQGWLSCFVVFLHSKFGQFVILSTFLLHLVVSIYLCTFVNTNFDMENLYLKESPLTPISHKMQNFVLKESFVVNFILDPMEGFENEHRRQQFNKMINELENIPKYGMGSKGSNLWTRDYESAAQILEDEDIWSPTQVYNNYRLFNLDPKNINTRKDKNGSTIIDSFTWHITYHNMRDFLDVEELLLQRRAILYRYSRLFSVTSHHPLEKVPTESAASAPMNFLQTAVSAIILMSILVFFFIMDPEAILSVIISILSICCGTVGYLHLWNVNLDAVSLISMLMSIGFSVDYSAHICYHFYTTTHEEEKPKMQRSSLKIKPTRITIGAESLQNDEKSSTYMVPSQIHPQEFDNSDTYERLYHTFGGVGWPVIQSGFSTIIGIIPLICVNAYVVAVFWKTIILVTFLGMYHALFILPAFFICFSNIRSGLKRCFSSKN